MSINDLLKNGVESSELVEVSLPDSNSEIIRENNGIVYSAMYVGLRGLFDKANQESANFGKTISDIIKHTLYNGGFFTTDELPGYSISLKEKQIILSQIYEFPNDPFVFSSKNDLVVCFAYDRAMAEKTKNLLDTLLVKYATQE
jgi:Glu-tRNA(Gln) amidotransferase subunit E-like FAD-binding protein